MLEGPAQRHQDLLTLLSCPRHQKLVRDTPFLSTWGPIALPSSWLQKKAPVSEVNHPVTRLSLSAWCPVYGDVRIHILLEGRSCHLLRGVSERLFSSWVGIHQAIVNTILSFEEAEPPSLCKMVCDDMVHREMCSEVLLSHL